MSKTSCAARCSRGSVQGVLRAPAKGEDGLAHTVRTSLLPPPSRSSGAPVRCTGQGMSFIIELLFIAKS